MPRRMTKEQQQKIAVLIQENRQQYYDENLAAMKKPTAMARKALEAVQDLPSNHPDRLAARAAWDAAWDIWYQWQQENDPHNLACEAKERRKRALGNKKKNRQKLRSKTEVFDVEAVETIKEAARTGPNMDFSSWLVEGGLVMTGDKEVGLVVEVNPVYPDYVRVMAGGSVTWRSKKSLRPTDTE